MNPVLREGNSDRRAPLSRQELRPPEPALHGCLDRRTPRPTWPPWTPTTSAPTRSPWSSTRTATSRIQLVDGRRHSQGAEGGLPGPGRRGHRRHRHARRRPGRVPGRPGCPRQGRGRAVLRPPEGHHDEGLRPDHLRPRRQGLLLRALRHLRRAARRRRPEPQQRPGRHPQRPRGPGPGGGPRRRPGSRSRRASTTARTWPWWTRTRASPTCTCPRT